ncbi:MAG: hypothetical protein IT178_01270 [Acidobacteria bacterium]|nr:hypothetical protein [Acidobacteriota bacterium]
MYQPSADRCAEILTEQARSMVEFKPTVTRAYADGVRTFLEIGPRGACTGWIHDILENQPHTAVATDGTRGSIRDLADTLTTIAAAGHAVDAAWWNSEMQRVRVLPPPEARQTNEPGIHLGGHLAVPAFDPSPKPVLRFPAPPALVPILPERLLPMHAAGADAPAVRAPEYIDATFVMMETTDSDLASSALLALAGTQEALLYAQHIAVAHLATDEGLAVESAVPDSAAAAFDTAAVERRGPEPVPHLNGATGFPGEAAELRTETAWPGMPPAGTPTFSREQLAIHAGGKISQIFGPAFLRQDSHRRQVRMPMDPLLLADRVTGLVGEPASMKVGTVWTETDIREDSWYVHDGRMPTGILIESGQADLFLISWLGIDLQDRGERVYRLLGCELTFHGGLPGIGDTLRYEIHIDSHARHGDIGLFFFHYDCWTGGDLRLSVRQGQAGFFTDEELAESAGVLWNPEEDAPAADAPLDPPRPGVTPASSYDDARVLDFAKGDVVSAFGSAFVRAASHTRTPRIPGGQMHLFDRVDELDVKGGPWGRGYMRATLDIHPDQWFFPGHFKNDPCMPGTLMFEGCLQTMAFYMAALGYTIDHDGWRFEPVQGLPYLLRCRGQVTPKSKTLTYEVFVSEVHDADEPMLIADLMCTVDGLRAFHCRRMALRLTPDNPFGPRELAAIAPDREPVAEFDGFRYGQASLLACANGNPVDAFGALYAVLPPTRRVPRLPAPPYHFISRVTALSQPPGGMQAGVTVETAYDIDPAAWFFDAHPTGQMPSCVLIEAALQPCGWLASYVGCAVHEADEVFFRNLDGSGVIHRAVRADDGCLRVKSTLKSLARAGGMTLVSFDVVCTVESETIYELKTTFGFFPKAALEGQAGLPAEGPERELAEARSGVDLIDTLGPAARACLPKPSVRMCERVTERRIDAEGKAALRGEKTVRPDEWFFKAHFFQDPVQPGSLGVEALVQLLQAHLLLEGAAEALPGGVFADMVDTGAGTWTFRGQVLPESRLVSLTLFADAIEKTPTRWTVRAQGSVWVDGRRIYNLRGLTVSFDATTPQPRTRRVRIDPATQPWWNDHRPTFAAPVLPGMAMVSLVLDAAPDAVGVDDLVLRRWLVLDQAKTIAIETNVLPQAPSPKPQAFLVTEGTTLLAEGQLVFDAGAPPAPVPALLADAPALDDPYASGAMFHGPAYHRVVSGRRSAAGADLVVRLDAEADARERISHIVLDTGLHGVPHDAMQTWFPEVEPGQVAYPAHVERFRVWERRGPRLNDGDPTASTTVEVRVRPADVRGSARFPRIHAQFIRDGQVWAELTLVEACFPATRLGQLPAADRRAFLRDGVFVPGARLSDQTAEGTTLTAGDLMTADWLPGTVRTLYGLPDGADLLPAVAAREHAAATLRVHPRAIDVADDGHVTTAALPLLDYAVTVEHDARRAVVRDHDRPRMDVDAVGAWWRERGWQSGVPQLQALFLAASRRFVRGVRALDPEAIHRLHGKPLLLLANHQVAVESVIAGTVLPPVIGRPLLTLAKTEHQDTWVGRLAMGLNDDRHGPAILYVDRDRQQDMLERLAEMAQAVRSGERSLMVHVEGTRATRGRQPVTTVSAVWADLAVKAGLTIVPLRYCGGLPIADGAARLEFPFGMGAQEFVLGRAMPGDTLASLPLPERRDRILAALAELDAYDFDPQPDPPFQARVMAARQRWDLDEVRAVFLLLQAEAQAWPLDDTGLPAHAMATRDLADPFWAWFEQAEGVKG